MRMEDDQQFCLRWNNHQSTLVAVFDTLLENGTLVDCTLAAEGKYLNAHKVVLSACSPYFEALLSQNYDKHPIFILKDVKYQELKAMMDYMYRGEVNISQDQLGALLKAAESLQIKGLSDNRKGETETRKAAPPPPPPAKTPPPATTTLPRVQGLTIEQRRRELEETREGSQSPGARKKKRIRRRSLDELDNHHDASNSSESHHSSQTPAQNINIPATIPAASSKLTDVPEPIETKSEILTRHKPSNESEVPQVPIKEKIETHSELMLEPKAEYIEEMNEDSIEDLTLDDDDLSNMEQMDDQGAGPSHGNMGEGSGQGFGGWHMGNQSQDEVFLAAQEAVGAHRDSQDTQQKPQIRIMKVEKLQNDKFLAKIKEELSSHIAFSKQDAKDAPKIVLADKKVAVIKVPMVKFITQKADLKKTKIETTEIVAVPAPLTEKKSDNAAAPSSPESPVKATNLISKERMKRFLRMTPEDLPRPGRKTYACEKDIKHFKTPKDTIRCTACGALYERIKRNDHLKDCRKTITEQHKYACASCNFKHSDIKEIEIHVETTHRKRK